MEGDNTGATAASAEASAASASAAESSAAVAASEAIIAAAAAEAAAANIERVETAVENAGEEIAAAAEVHADAAVEAAVTQIEADLEAENTWLNIQLTEVKRDLEVLKTTQGQSSSELMTRISGMESLLSNLQQLLPNPTRTAAQSDEVAPEAARTSEPAPSRQTKHRRI